jgi:hypothetical protein
LIFKMGRNRLSQNYAPAPVDMQPLFSSYGLRP